uniref:Phospholipid phosphatase related 5b n=1 Tax=Cyprinodon variegatus TaxID=28743 RepID=A0A3Q2DBB3_CYPVA
CFPLEYPVVSLTIPSAFHYCTVLYPLFSFTLPSSVPYRTLRYPLVTSGVPYRALWCLLPYPLVSLILLLVSLTFDRSEKTVATGDCCYLNPLVRRTFRFLGVYAFGLFTVDIFVNAGQVVTGNLAPYFLTVCKPNYTALGCQQALRYISHQEACTGNQDDILRARKTFPSKEAALSVYAALYLAMYVTYTVRAKGTRLAKPLLSLGFMCLAFLTGLNRVAEYRNHWADVIAGFIIGMAIATFLVRTSVCSKVPLWSHSQRLKVIRGMAMLNMGQVESPLEKYIASQVGSALLLSRNIQNQHPGNALSFSSCGEAYGDLRMFVC